MVRQVIDERDAKGGLELPREQWVRARAEEQLLGADPGYAAYRQRVRYRLIPGLI